jgi:hypothetical protein
MASMLTSYNLPLRVVVSTFNACVCNVHGARTINNLRFGIIWESRCHLMFIAWFWSNKLDNRILYHLRFNVEICKSWSWNVVCDGKSQLSVQLGDLKCCYCTTTPTGNVCASWFIVNKVSIYFQFFRKNNFFSPEIYLCNMGPILCNYVKLQSPMCILHYVIKKILSSRL